MISYILCIVPTQSIRNTNQPSHKTVMTIAIFPASGGLGGSTLSHLLDTAKLEPTSLVLVARHPEKLANEKARGATIRQADFDHPETLEGCFEGVDALNLISYASFQHEYRFKVSNNSS